MKKTKRQKAFEWHHLMAGNVFSKPYMLKTARWLTGNKKSRFDMRWFRSHVLRMIRKNKLGHFPHGGNCACFEQGIFITFPSKKVSILKCHTTKR